MALYDRSEKVPSAVQARLEQALRRGSTTLRSGVGHSSPRPRLLAAAAVGVLALGGMFLYSSLTPRQVSAAEVLNRSLRALAATQTGIEYRKYSMDVAGLAAVAPAKAQDGAYTVEQWVDNSNPGRYRVQTLGPDGKVQSAIAQDSNVGTRQKSAVIDNQTYLYRFSVTPGTKTSMPALEQAKTETMVSMMLASADTKMTTRTASGGGLEYVIEMPELAARANTSVWEMQSARIVIRDGDFRIVEYATSGTLVGSPYSLHYVLTSQETVPGTGDEIFQLKNKLGDVVIDGGKATENPLWDMLRASVKRIAVAAPAVAE